MLVTRPPWVIPYCRLCDQPVERFTLGNPTNDFHAVTVEAECCGKTQGIRVTHDELMRVKRLGEKLWCVVRKGQAQGLDRHGWVARRAYMPGKKKKGN